MAIMLRIPFGLAALVLVAAFAGPVAASDRTICVRGEIDQRVAACTRLINVYRASTSKTSRTQATVGEAYRARGIAYRLKGDYDRAIADLTVSIRLYPIEEAYNSRGHAYRSKGDFDHALADYSEAIRMALFAKNVVPYPSASAMQ